MRFLRSLAAAQTVPVRGDVEANLEQHLRLLGSLPGKPVRVLVFPELSLTGYELEQAASLAFSENDRRLEPLTTAAVEHATTLIVGAPVRVRGRLHIGAFIVSPRGTVETYTKHRLGAFSPEVSADGIVPPPESSVFEPGDRQPLVPLEGGSAAVGICAESLREAHPKAAAERGARTYLTSHFGIPLDVALRARVLRGHAVRHSMAVVFANYGGPTGGLPGGGCSAIWSPAGELLAQLPSTGGGLAIARETKTGWLAETVVL